MHYLFQFREITFNLTDFLELVTHKGSSIKHVRSDFVILTQPRPPVRAHTLLAYFKDMAQTNFANYYQSKNHKQCYKIKELMYKAIKNCSIRTPKKNSGIKFALFNCTGEMEMDNFGYLSTHFILLLFCNEPEKKIYGVHAYAYS